MTVVVVMVALLWDSLCRMFGVRAVVAGAVALVLIAIAPAFAALGAVIGLCARGWWRWQSHRRNDDRSQDDVAVFARGLFVAVNAGLSLPAAIEIASENVGTAVAQEVTDLNRDAHRKGMAVALSEADGRCGRLFMLLARAQTTGASVGEAIAGFVEEQREFHRLKVTEAARRLPVKLTVPLALLILPGFVVLTVGPSVLESARRLLGPLVPVP